MSIILHKNDLSADVDLGNVVAVDTETLGLNYNRDPLCLVQLSSGDGTAHIVQLDRSTYDAPNLSKVLTDPDAIKIFHYARFDIVVLKKYMGIECAPVFCTKIASKLTRTYTDRHGLRHCCRELLGVELSKQQQSSDWGADNLTEEQLKYAANDVLYLHALKEKFDSMLEREGRIDLARRCFDFLHTRADLDIAGWNNVDIFEH